MDRINTKTRAAMAQMKRDVNESNRTLAIMGETIGVGIPRHIRGFISQLPGVSTALSAAFSGVAIILVGKVIIEVAEKVHKLVQEFNAAGESAKKIGEGFAKINEPIEKSNHQLELSIIKTQNAIAKLEHKPQNFLAEALAEAAVRADELSSKLHSALEESVKLLKQEDHGYLMRLARNTTGTQQAQDINAWGAEQERGLQHDQDYDGHLRAISKEMWNRAYLGIQQNLAAANPKIAHDAAHPFTGVDPTIANGALFELQTNRSNIYRNMDLEDKDISSKSPLRGLQGKSKGSGKQDDAARDAERALIKVLDERTEQQHKIIADYDRLDVTGRDRTLPDQLKFLDAISPEAGNRDFLRDSRNKVWDKMQAEGMDASGNVPTPSVGSISGKLKGLDPEEIERARMEVARFNREMAKTRDEVAAKSIDWAEKTGQMSHYAAATALAALHTQEFNEQLGMLRAEHDQILMDRMTGKITQPAADEAFARNQNAQGTLIANRPLQSAEDKYNQQSQTAMQGMRDFWDAAIKDADNAAKTVNALFTQAMTEVNAQLVNGMMGKKMDWGKTFGSLASSTLSSGLKTGEGMIGKALGLGGKKGDSPMNPMYVSQVNALPGAAGGAGAAGGGGGIFGSLLKLFHIPGFAEGGYPSGLAMVGENGPELANFGGGGHVTSNSDVRAMLKGGGGSPVYNIDARGSNAADVQMRVKQAMQVTHAHAVQSSMQAQRELAARRPRSS
jgi:hypothetical protein